MNFCGRLGHVGNPDRIGLTPSRGRILPPRRLIAEET